MTPEIERLAETAALKAGDVIRDSVGRLASSQVRLKGPSDYVTEIDHQCEDLIMGMVRSRFPDHHIMSEETASDGLQPGVTWVIDPLDGTANFIHGFPHVAVSIAVCLDRTPVFGVVLDPLRGELFSARLGGGAYLNGRRLDIRQTSPLEHAMIATGFPHRSRGVLEPYLDVFKSVFFATGGIRRAGSAALDLCYLAAGRVDGFWEVGLKAWDVAAGSLMVTETGGQVSDFWGKGDYLYNGHIVGGTTLVYPFLLEQVRTFLVPALE